ncbi:uncharacterized protein C2orf92 homolog [Alexandromys fortis]|uniref:uncharacterized protein C2orf92 homolog n=1 Tax=Alexandromys fortis TaxID=100897 RepID=UPI002152A795|nr:uncharacterized protein C2orf92 homolog [Microtus fortis]
MSDTVFFSFVLFLGSQWGAEPHSIPVTEGVENSFSSSSSHFEEDLAKLFDEILLQVFPSDLDDMSKDARTPGRLITWREANESKYLWTDSKCLCFYGWCSVVCAVPGASQNPAMERLGIDLRTDFSTAKICFPAAHAPPNSFNNSEFASSSHLAKLFDEILLQVFSNDPKHLSKEDARAADELVMWRDTNESKYMSGCRHGRSGPIPNSVSAVGNRLEDVYTESLPCRELLSFLQKNIITATAAMAAILLVTTLVVLALVTYIRRKKAKYPPANMTYNVFIMNGKAWWQKPEERSIRKFTGKQKLLKCNSSV